MNYCINPDDDEPIFLLDCQIGKDDAQPNEPYIDSQSFVRELLYIDSLGKKRIQVWIESPGGYVSDGMSIYHAMLKTKTKVDTFCVGRAYSIAGVIFQAGRKRYMMDYATLMYHNAYTADGKKDKSLELTNDSIAQMVSGRSWNDVEAVKKMMAKTSFITAREALDSGLCDEVESVADFNKPRVISTAEPQAYWKDCHEYVNKILTPKYKNNQQTQKPMKIVAKILNLNEEASEDAIAMEVKKIQNQANQASALEDNLAKAQKDLKKAQDEFKDFKDKMTKEEEDRKATAKKAEEDRVEKEKKDAEDKKVMDAKKADDDRMAMAKQKIIDLDKARNTMLSAEALETYIALAITNEENCAKAVKAIEAITVVRGAKFQNRTIKDETGIPLIADGEDTTQSPTGKGAGDTSKVIDAINSFQFHKHKGRVAI